METSSSLLAVSEHSRGGVATNVRSAAPLCRVLQVRRVIVRVIIVHVKSRLGSSVHTCTVSVADPHVCTIRHAMLPHVTVRLHEAVTDLLLTGV